jgi:hypothetical protein
MRAFPAAPAALFPAPGPARGGSPSSSKWSKRGSGFAPVALKPIGRSPAYYTSNRLNANDPSDVTDGSRRSPIAKLCGNSSEMKATVGRLEYELGCARNHVTELGLELSEAKAELAKIGESRELYKERCTLQEKEIFALERQNEETKKGFDTGMGMAKRQIKMLESRLKEAEK